MARLLRLLVDTKEICKTITGIALFGTTARDMSQNHEMVV